MKLEKNVDRSGFGKALLHITEESRNLEDDECGWDAAGLLRPLNKIGRKGCFLRIDNNQERR